MNKQTHLRPEWSEGEYVLIKFSFLGNYSFNPHLKCINVIAIDITKYQIK